MAKKKQGESRNLHAVTLGAMGASKGGKARAAKLSPKERSKIAKKGGHRGGKGRPGSRLRPKKKD